MNLFRFASRCKAPIGAQGIFGASEKSGAATKSASRVVILASALVVVSLAAEPASAAQYKLTDIGVFSSPGGDTSSVRLFVAADGAVAGSGGAGVGGNFLWTPFVPNGTTGSSQSIPPPPSSPQCFVGGINAAHHVSCDNAASDPTIWTGGNSYITLPSLQVGYDNGANQINDLDSVVGSAEQGVNFGTQDHAVWWQVSGAPAVVLDARNSLGIGLNNTGSFVGAARGDDDLFHATAWAFVVFGIVPRTLNSTSVSSAAYAINDSGTAAGFVGTKPAAWASSGIQTDLPLHYGGSTGAALSINASGDIVGHSTTKYATFLGQTIVPVATLWSGSAVTDLNLVTDLPDGWTLSNARGINDVGQIVGIALDADGYLHAVLLTPFSNQPPVALCKAAAVSADAACKGSASIDNGSHDDDSDSFSLSQLPAPLYSLGTTSVTLTATDSDGASASCSANVTVQDNTAPSATCPAATSASAGPSCKAAVPNVLGGVSATDNCSGTANLSMSQDIAAGSLVGLGTTPIRITVTDAASNGGVCSTAFTVVDTSGPSLTTAIAQPILWTPSHELVNVGLSIAASDNCDAAPSVLTTVFSNESDQPVGDADASFSPDARNIAPASLRVRAERLQAGTGRVYLIVAQSTDSANNTSASCATVVVPHDQNNRSLAVVNALAGPAQAYCSSHGGAAPAGYVPVGSGAPVGPKQ